MERYQNNIQDQYGNALDGVTVTVRLVSDGSLATIYSDNVLTGKSNPFTNDADGELFFYAANDRYDVFFTGAITDQVDDILLADLPSSSSGNTRIISDTDAPAGPTGQVGTATLDYYDSDESTQIAQIGFIGGSNGDMRWRNNVRAAHLQLTSFDTGGTEVFCAVLDPDGEAALYYSGTKRFGGSTNYAVVYGDDDSDTGLRGLSFAHSDATVRGFVGWNLAVSTMFFSNEIHSGLVAVTGEDASGNLRNFLVGDPDALTTINGDTDVHILVNVGAEIAVEAVANGKVGLRYNNIETFRTILETTADIGMGAEVLHADGSFYPVGMNVVPPLATLDSGNATLAQANVGMRLTYNTATARSVLLNDDANIKVGAMWSLHVGPSAGTLTGDGGAGVVIRWWNGTGWTATAAAGNITIGVGDYNIWKETDTLYHISGPTLS